MSRPSLLLLPGLCASKAQIGCDPYLGTSWPLFPAVGRSLVQNFKHKSRTRAVFLAARGGNRPVF